MRVKLTRTIAYAQWRPLCASRGSTKWNARRSSTFGGSTIHRLHVLKLVAARHAEVNLSAAGGAVGAVKAGI